MKCHFLKKMNKHQPTKHTTLSQKTSFPSLFKLLFYCCSALRPTSYIGCSLPDCAVRTSFRVVYDQTHMHGSQFCCPYLQTALPTAGNRTNCHLCWLQVHLAPTCKRGVGGRIILVLLGGEHPTML